MQKLYLFLLLSLSLFISSGCSPISNKYSITIDAITAPNLIPIPTTYTIKALGKQTNENSLRFQQQATLLNKLLQKKGYKRVEDEKLAQEIIFFDYGIEKVQEEIERYREPQVYMGFSIGRHRRFSGGYYSPFWSDFGYYRSYSRQYNYYNRYATILATKPQGKELWRVDISSIGESKNLRKIVPLLLEASVPYIGKNTKEPIKLVIKEKIAKKE